MIITALLYLIYSAILILLSPLLLLGDVSLSSNFSTAISNASGYLNSLNAIVPIDTILTIFGFLLVILYSWLVYTVIMWVIKKIPTLN